MPEAESDNPTAATSRRGAFRHAVLRGLALVAPPLLTVVIFVWIGSTIYTNILAPIHNSSRHLIAWQIREVRETLPEADPVEGRPGVFTSEGREWFLLPKPNMGAKDNYVPNDVYQHVRQYTPASLMPTTGEEIYSRYVELKYLRPEIVYPLVLVVFVLLLYALGRSIAAGAGRVLWNFFDGLIHRMPLVRNVYSSVKQVTDFMLSEREVEYTRVVAVEYPRKGVWSLGLVTGESMSRIHEAAGDPVVSVLIPSSPMPITGYTITVRKSETVDLNITIDQAFQFCISCGVVVPKSQVGGGEKLTEPPL